MRLGTVLPVAGMSLRDSLDVGVAAEALGYDDVWTSEVDAQDGLTSLAALAARTDRVRLGVSLLPAQTRPPALLAMSAASLQDLSLGRFVLGLGASTPTVVEGWMGLEQQRPATRVRETILAVRLALTGERIDFEGDTVSMTGFRLGLPASHVPIMVGALGPGMFRLAGEEADGVLLSFTAAAAIPLLLEEFRSAAGTRVDELDIVCRVPVAFGQDSPPLRAALRRLLAGYAIVPAYRASFSRQGFTDEVGEIAAAWAGGDRAGAAGLVSESMLESLTVFGSAEQCAGKLAAYRDAGVKTLLVSPVSTESDGGRLQAATLEALECIARLGLGESAAGDSPTPL